MTFSGAQKEWLKKNTDLGSLLEIVEIPKAKAILYILPDFYIETKEAKPNWFREFWYWALLGWKWKNL